jgi:hypothetical protein
MTPDHNPDPFTEEDCIPWDPDGWDTSVDEENEAEDDE